MTIDQKQAWEEWQKQQIDLYFFPQLEESQYYDMKHPNKYGRPILSEYFIHWLENRNRKPSSSQQMETTDEP